MCFKHNQSLTKPFWTLVGQEKIKHQTWPSCMQEMLKCTTFVLIPYNWNTLNEVFSWKGQKQQPLDIMRRFNKSSKQVFKQTKGGKKHWMQNKHVQISYVYTKISSINCWKYIFELLWLNKIWTLLNMSDSKHRVNEKLFPKQKDVLWRCRWFACSVFYFHTQTHSLEMGCAVQFGLPSPPGVVFFCKTVKLNTNQSLFPTWLSVSSHKTSAPLNIFWINVRKKKKSPSSQDTFPKGLKRRENVIFFSEDVTINKK